MPQTTHPFKKENPDVLSEHGVRFAGQYRIIFWWDAGI
jgi:hypothetical protein